MDTYLLDTNIISSHLNPFDKHHDKVSKYIAGLDVGSVKYISAVTMGEMEFGFELAYRNGRPLDQLERILAQARRCAILEITRHTAKPYGDLRTALAKTYMPHRSSLGMRKGLPRWPDAWFDENTAEKLGIDENDLWISSQAAERNLNLITLDSDISRRIEEAAKMTAWGLRVTLIT